MKKIQKNEISASAKKSMVTRIITGIAMAAVAIPAIVIGGWFFFFAVLVLALISAIEIVRVANLKGLMKVFIYFVTIFFTLGIIYYSMLQKNMAALRTDGSAVFSQNSFLPDSFNDINISIMLVTLMLISYFLISFAAEPFHIAYVFYFVSMILVVTIGMQSFMFLRYSPYYFFNESLKAQNEIFPEIYIPAVIDVPEFQYGQSMFLSIYVIIGVTFNDMGAYFTGLLFGKHKMNERISPKKTWEGFFGGVAISVIFSSLFAIITAACGKPILPFFDLSHIYYPIILSLLIPLISDVGDFVFSSVKRTFGVKDFSNLLPGHGGILDRIDSLIFASALVSTLIVFINLMMTSTTAI